VHQKDQDKFSGTKAAHNMIIIMTQPIHKGGQTSHNRFIRLIRNFVVVLREKPLREEKSLQKC